MDNEKVIHRYIYKNGLYKNYTKSINPKEEPLKALRFIIMYLFDSNRYDVKLHMDEEEPFVTVKDKKKNIYIKIASFETHEGDIIMNIYPKPKKYVIQSQEIIIDEMDKNYFMSVFWDTVDDYTFNIEAYLDAPYLGRSMLEEELYQLEQKIDDDYEYEIREENRRMKEKRRTK
jgi:hypothetical protein